MLPQDKHFGMQLILFVWTMKGKKKKGGGGCFLTENFLNTIYNSRAD